MGCSLSDDLEKLACELGPSGAVLCSSAGDTKDRLDDQRDRIDEHVPAKSDKDEKLIPQRRRPAEAALPGPAERHEDLDPLRSTRLEGRHQPLRHSLRRPDTARPSPRLIDQLFCGRVGGGYPPPTAITNLC